MQLDGIPLDHKVEDEASDIEMDVRYLGYGWESY